MAQSEDNPYQVMVYDIPVFREINIMIDWFSSLIWYWQIAVAFGLIFGIWMVAKIIGFIFRADAH